MVNIISRDPGAPPADYIKASGGIFKDMTIHDLDMARFLLGEEIEKVFATASVLVDPNIGALGDFDNASLILTTASGKQCSISNSRRATVEGFVRPPLHDFFMTRYTQAYENEIAAFIEMIIHNTTASPNGHDGFAALALAEAALKSVTEGRSIGIVEM